VTLNLVCPTTPLGAILAEVRRHVSVEAGRHLGRAVRRVDLTVSRLVTDPSRPVRRVL
jgi:hypothetical protein